MDSYLDHIWCSDRLLNSKGWCLFHPAVKNVVIV